MLGKMLDIHRDSASPLRTPGARCAWSPLSNVETLVSSPFRHVLLLRIFCPTRWAACGMRHAVRVFVR